MTVWRVTNASVTLTCKRWLTCTMSAPCFMFVSVPSVCYTPATPVVVQGGAAARAPTTAHHAARALSLPGRPPIQA